MTDMRFVLLDTKNNAGFINALGSQCDVISNERHSKSDIDKNTRSEIHAIAERNVTRRKIRFPALFGFAPIATLYRWIYRKQVKAKYSDFMGALATDTSRTVLVFNGYLAPNALLSLAAQKLGMKRLFLENGFFPNTIQCDATGINALSTLPNNADFYDRLTDDQIGEGRPETLVTRASKLKDGAVKAPVALPEKYIFAPFQVPSDMQILALSPWIKNMVQFYDEIYALADRFPEKHFVIKEHPSFPLSIQSKTVKHPLIHFRNADVTETLIKHSEAVLTVNSTVGLEALTLGKKVVTLGNAHYAVEGLTAKANNRQELQDIFAKLDKWETNDIRCEKFIRFVNNRYLLNTDIRQPDTSIAQQMADRAMGEDVYSKLVSANSA